MRVNRLKGGIEFLEKELFHEWAIEVADKGLSALRHEAPKDTGELALSHYSNTDTSSKTVTFYSRSNHAKYVIHGHGDIYPIEADVLAWQDGNSWIFAQHVGPVAGNNYPLRAMLSIGLKAM